MITPGLVTVKGTEALPLFPVTQAYRGQSVFIRVGANDIWIGPDNTVKPTGVGFAQGGTRGTRYPAYSEVTLDLDAGEAVYAITADTNKTSDTEVMQQGSR